MNDDTRMKRLCDFYIRHVTIIGALYCAVPTVGWFAGMFIMIPLREVYLLRMALSLVVGCAVAAYVNRLGLSLWLAKHSSREGPATAVDGALIGAAVGMGTALLPPLTALISTHHLELAKSFIIVSWLAAAAIGAIIGGTLAAIGRKHIERSRP